MKYIFRKSLFYKDRPSDYKPSEYVHAMADALDGRVVGDELNSRGLVNCNFEILPEWCEIVEGS